MNSKIENLINSYVGEDFYEKSKKGRKTLEKIFKNDYKSLLRTKKVNEFYEEMESRDERGLLRHLEESAGTASLAGAIYDENPDYFNSLFSSRIDCFFDTGNPLFISDSLSVRMDNMSDEKKVCVTEIKYALESYHSLKKHYKSCFN